MLISQSAHPLTASIGRKVMYRSSLTRDASSTAKHRSRRESPDGCLGSRGNRPGALRRHHHIPKDLITGLQVTLQLGSLQIAGGIKSGPALVTEMAEMWVRIALSGNEQYGARREGSHDDLAFAVALALWATRKAYLLEAGDSHKCWTVSLRRSGSNLPEGTSS